MRFLLITILSSFLLLMNSCETVKQQSEITYPLETAKLISGSTSGTISSSSEIQVRFSENIIPADLINQPVTKSVFSFSPAIDGHTFWKDERTLIFKPNQKLPLLQEYQAELNLKLLLSQRDKNLKPFPFRFQVGGREVEFFSADFYPVNADDPKFLIYKGEITFTEAVQAKLLNKAVTVQTNQKKISLNWQADASGRNFSFTSKPLARSKQSKSFTFTLDQKALEISASFSQRLKLPSLSALTISDVQIVADQAQPQLQLHFSDDLLPSQDLNGFIQIEPHMTLKLKRTGKKVLVQANFEHGQTYSIIAKPGIRSKWATKTEQDFKEKITFEDLLPKMRFANNGVFLPSSNKQKIAFQTVNVRRVDLKIIKVFESNLGHFLHLENLNGNKDRNRNFNYNIKQVGIEVIQKELQIGTERNRWLQHELDLQNLLKEKDKGLFLVQISFEREDMLYQTSERDLQYRRRYDYYNDPASHGYLYQHGRIYKPIVVSDIGLTYKNAGKDHHIFVSNIVEAKPLASADVKLFSYQNQLLTNGRSNADGMVVFRNIKDKVFYISAEKSGQRSVIKPNGMRWNISTFDTDGKQPSESGLRSFIYTERGVYRPGDTVNLSAIFRNEQNTFPDAHPVTVTIKNPLRQAVIQKTIKNAKDGFYHFSFSTGPNDITGAYRAELDAGSQKFYHDIKVETIIPERLKINLEAQKEKLGPADKQLKLSLSSAYLMGNPASNLEAEVKIELTAKNRSFKVFNDFLFSNPSREFRPIRSNLFQGKLDNTGKKQITWNLPELRKAPSAITGRITAKVFEKGGRAAQRSLDVSIDPFNYFVGIKKPQTRYGSIRTGDEIKVPVILVDSSGQAKAGRTLQYRIYKNEHNWWYEYHSRDRFRLRFKRDRSTELISEGTIISGSAPVPLTFTAEDRGQYFIEVQDGNANGHSSGFFIQAWSWGRQQTQGKEAGILTLQADKESYRPGEEAVISFPVPDKASILLTLEKGTKILDSQWLRAKGKNNEHSLRIPITEEMLPTTYVSVSVIQPQTQVENDRPLRMYGIIPLNVEEPSTRQQLNISMPDELQAGERFKVNVQTQDRKATRLTIAVVDEGLLSLTRFETPNPWKSFFSKQRLGVLTSDLYDQVIGINRGDIFRTFSIGGGLSAAEAYRQSQLAPEKKRFEPVCLFSGIIETDKNGKAQVEFDMPEYIGAVRVMAVSANGNRYGNAEKTVPVKKPVMLLPTLPRAVAPGDVFTMPVTVFVNENKANVVHLRIQTSGPIQVSGNKQKTIRFNNSGQQDVSFVLKAKQETGSANITIQVEADNYTSVYQQQLPVRPASARITKYEQKVIEPGKRVAFQIPDDGLPGSNKARLHIRRRPNIKLTRRILQLIRYPYGCIEQTISAAFPQLYIQDFIPKSRAAERDIDKDINESIYRLSKFQLPSDAFSYWPGRRDPSIWGTLYAVHFMVEAKQAGYHVPENLLTKTLPFIKKQLRISSDWELLEKAYAIYVLALAGEAPLGSMNLLRENYFSKLNDTERWLLAASYALSGNKSTADKLIQKTGVKVGKYKHFSRTFGSAYRDKALILEQLIRFERWNQASALADELAEALSSNTWYSTQSSGFMLIALGKYLRAVEGQDGKPKRMSGAVILANGKKVPFTTDKISHTIEIEQGFGKQVFLELDKQTNVQRAFAELEWSGLPLKYAGKNEAHNINVKVKFLDEDGMPLDPASIAQGSSFWMHFRIYRSQNIKHQITELALTQLLPAGWEIDNYSLLENKRPSWMSKWNAGREKYRDFRDDRAMWFFDLGGKGLDFVLKLNAVTKGSFFLPPTWVEAMYNHSYRAQKAGRQVQVTGR